MTAIDRNVFIDVFQFLMACSSEARRGGLFAIEKYTTAGFIAKELSVLTTYPIHLDFLEALLQCIVDGTDVDELKMLHDVARKSIQLSDSNHAALWNLIWICCYSLAEGKNPRATTEIARQAIPFPYRPSRDELNELLKRKSPVFDEAEMLKQVDAYFEKMAK
jgi:flagellar motor component MotA